MINDNGVPYTEEFINNILGEDLRDGGVIDVSIRHYPKTTTICFTDGQDTDYSTGADLEDCYIGPTYGYKKFPNKEFYDNRDKIIEELHKYLEYDWRILRGSISYFGYDDHDSDEDFFGE